MDKCRISKSGTDTVYGFVSTPAAREKTWSLWGKTFLFCGKLAAVAFLLCAGCQGPKRAVAPLPSQAPGALVAGDTLRISFPGAPELNQTQKIGTDGKLSLPLVGDVVASGKSVGELQAELMRLYKSQLQESEVL